MGAAYGKAVKRMTEITASHDYVLRLYGAHARFQELRSQQGDVSAESIVRTPELDGAEGDVVGIDDEIYAMVDTDFDLAKEIRDELVQSTTPGIQELGASLDRRIRGWEANAPGCSPADRTKASAS